MDEYTALLTKLAADHLQTAVETGYWVDYLKAHGIANHLIALDPAHFNWHRRVYDIERQWYNDRHPLTYTEHQDLNRKHKEQLSKYREKTRENFDSLRTQQESLDIDEIFSEENLDNAHEFSQKVFINSKICSDDFVEFSGSIIESSVDCLKRIGLIPPCPFAVIALGSVARGEATPYSDLEYAFIVEKEADNKYFEKLAVDTYFKIGNLNESPLKTFTVEADLKSINKDVLPSVGLRIDGLSKRARHIPTGNGSSTALTFTVLQAMNLYREELMSSGNPTANLSNLLSTSVLIYSSEEGGQLHKEFLTERLKYEKEEAQANFFVKRKRLNMFWEDLNQYDFLPEFRIDVMKHADVQVKADIFRYPTLLATNLNISLGLNCRYPWVVNSKLQELEILIREDVRYLNIILGLSIYIRTTSYLATQTQATKLSLLTAAFDLNQCADRHYVPKNVFVILGCLLIPAKASIKAYAQLPNFLETDVVCYLRSSVKPFQLDRNDFMLKAEVFCFLEDFQGALAVLNYASGRKFTLISCVQFIEILRRKYNTNQADLLEKKYLAMCYTILSGLGHAESAIDYLSWLFSYATNTIDTVQLKLLVSEELHRLNRFKPAKNILLRIIATLKRELALDEQTSLPEFLLRKLNTQPFLPEMISQICTIVCCVYQKLGVVFQLLDDLPKSLKYFQLSVKIRQTMTDKESTTSELNDQREIAILLNNIGQLYIHSGDCLTALEYHTKSLEMMKTIYGENTNQIDIATSYSNVGSVLARLGNYPKSIDYHSQSLQMCKAVYGEHTNHPDIATRYSRLGSVHYKFGDYAAALEYHAKALKMRKVVYGEYSDNHDTAISYCNIGNVHNSLGDYTAAIYYYNKSLRMSKAVYGEHNIAPINLTTTYHNVLDMYIASKRYKEALPLCTQLLTGSTLQPPILNSVSQTWIGLSQFSRAKQFLLIAIRMASKVCQQSEEQADNYYQMGICCLHTASWKKCWCWLYSALTRYQSLPRTVDNKLSLAKVNLSISHLLLQLGHMTQSLEHAQRALDISEELKASATLPNVHCLKVHREAISLNGALHLIKISSEYT